MGITLWEYISIGMLYRLGVIMVKISKLQLLASYIEVSGEFKIDNTYVSGVANILLLPEILLQFRFLKVKIVNF